jgi:hypothetical protein
MALGKASPPSVPLIFPAVNLSSIKAVGAGLSTIAAVAALYRANGRRSVRL